MASFRIWIHSFRGVLFLTHSRLPSRSDSIPKRHAMLYSNMQRHHYFPGFPNSHPIVHGSGHNCSASVPILLPRSSLPIREPLIVTPTILPTSFTPAHSGTSSANNLTHLVASSVPIGFRNDICKCCTTVGIVNEAWVTRDLAASVLASSQCFFEDTAKLSRTGTISGRR